jgi:hypothetical protein
VFAVSVFALERSNAGDDARDSFGKCRSSRLAESARGPAGRIDDALAVLPRSRTIGSGSGPGVDTDHAVSATVPMSGMHDIGSTMGLIFAIYGGANLHGPTGGDQSFAIFEEQHQGPHEETMSGELRVGHHVFDPSTERSEIAIASQFGSGRKIG